MKRSRKDHNTQRFPIRYAFYDRTNIQRFLEQKSEEGWMLQTFGSGTFVRTEPKKRHFCIVYYSDKFTPDRTPYERRQEFLEYCKHDGWELVTQNDRMMIFCSEQESPTPIETDPLMEVQNIHTAAKSAFWGNCSSHLINGIFLIFLFFFRLCNDLTDLLSAFIFWMYLPMGCIGCFLAIREITIYYRWYHAAKKAAADGMFLDTPKRSDLSRVTTILLSLCLILGFCADQVVPYFMIGAIAVVGILLLVIQILKKCKVSEDIWRPVALLICFPLCMAAILLGVFLAEGEIAHDALPLSICDLTEADPSRYTATLTNQSTFLVSRQTGKHTSGSAADDYPDIRYTVTTIHASFLYDVCVSDLMSERNYSATDAGPWGARDAYLDAQSKDYLLFYEDRIVQIRIPWAPSEEQMATVGQKLGGK